MDRTHWQFFGVLDPETLVIEEVGAFFNTEPGVMPPGTRHEGKVMVLICEIKTRSIEDSRIGLRAILEERHPWVFEKFPDARFELMNEAEHLAYLAAGGSP